MSSSWTVFTFSFCHLILEERALQYLHEQLLFTIHAYIAFHFCASKRNMMIRWTSRTVALSCTIDNGIPFCHLRGTFYDFLLDSICKFHCILNQNFSFYNIYSNNALALVEVIQIF